MRFKWKQYTERLYNQQLVFMFKFDDKAMEIFHPLIFCINNSDPFRFHPEFDRVDWGRPN
jgi:hypothetical protein